MSEVEIRRAKHNLANVFGVENAGSIAIEAGGSGAVFSIPSQNRPRYDGTETDKLDLKREIAEAAGLRVADVELRTTPDNSVSAVEIKAATAVDKGSALENAVSRAARLENTREIQWHR